MPTLAQIRGAILEEIVLILLENAGYRILNENDGEEIRKGPSGLELQGRGEWHQVDALVSYDFTPSFIYPLRLIVESKAYLPSSNGGKVKINIVRNAVGVLKDVNENFFSFHPQSSEKPYLMKRFNYTYAIFSLYGFTKNAQRYAIAHQIFLIQYYHNPLFEGIRENISQINSRLIPNLEDINLKDLRQFVRNYLKIGRSEENQENIFFSQEGIGILDEIKNNLNKIKGSYFGLLNGEYPVHLISKKPISNITSDEIDAEIYVIKAKYVLVTFDDNELYFELPESIAEVFSKIWDSAIEIARTKKKYINYIALTGKIDGIRRNLLIKLNKEWLNELLTKNIS